LFDYESKQVVKNSFKLADSTAIIRVNDGCVSKPYSYQHMHENGVPLLGVRPKENECSVHLIHPGFNERMWLAVRYMKKSHPKGFKLSEGEWIKLGRVRLRVKKINLNPTNSMPEEVPAFLGEESVCNSAEVKESMPCRICLYDTQTQDNPLISPCKCSGTMKLVHISCLQEWLRNKVATRQSGKATSYYWKDMACELCKVNLPSTIVLEGVKWDLISITYPNQAYVLLEDFRPDRSQSHGLHVVSLSNNQSVELGRSHESDIKISDISVSRKHAKLKYHNNSFYLEDLGSKFGTLVQLKKSFNIHPGSEVSVQVNRTLITLSLKQPWSCRACLCFCALKKIMPISDCSFITQADLEENYWSEPSPVPRNQRVDEVYIENPSENSVSELNGVDERHSSESLADEEDSASNSGD